MKIWLCYDINYYMYTCSKIVSNEKCSNQNDARNNVIHLFTLATTIYFTDHVEECGKDQKALVSDVDEILGQKKELILLPLLPNFSIFFLTKIKL